MATLNDIQKSRIASSIQGTFGSDIQKADKSEGLATMAKNMSEEELKRTISSDPNEAHRKAAHSELDRRVKEEAPQEEEKVGTISDKVAKDKEEVKKSDNSDIQKARDILGLK